MNVILVIAMKQRSLFIFINLFITGVIMYNYSFTFSNLTFASNFFDFYFKDKLAINILDRGAKGDGNTIISSILQDTINALKNAGGGTIYFPPGVYLVYDINIPPGIRFLGSGSGKSILKAPDGVHLLKGSTSWRMLRTATSPFKYSGDEDSPPLVFQDICIDYNGPNQYGWNSYAGEQNFCLELGASNTRPGRLKVFFINSELRYSCSDGISVLANVDLYVSNSVFKSNFRGSITILGGHSRISAQNIKIYNDLGFYFIGLQSEPETVCSGYPIPGKGLTYFELILENAEVDGSIDLGNRMDSYGLGTYVKFNNVKAPLGDLFITNGGGGTFRFYNCIFGQLNNWYFLAPRDTIFNNCKFILRKLPNGNWADTCVRLAWNLSSTYQNQLLEFNDCTFTAEDYTNNASNITSACKLILQDSYANNNLLRLNRCIITDKLKTVINSNYNIASKIELNDIISYATQAHLIPVGTTDNLIFDIKLNNYQVKNGYLLKFNNLRKSCKLTFEGDHIVNEAHNYIESIYYLTTYGLTISGKRIIYGTTPPTPATHGLVGDLYVLLSNPNQVWVCTKASYYDHINKVNIYGNWVIK